MARIKKQRFGLYKNPTYSTVYYNLALGDITIVYAYNADNGYRNCHVMETRGLVTQAFNLGLL